ALTLEVQGALREDLRVLAMSATLETERLAARLGNAPIIASEGRAFPVETRWLERPWRAGPGRKGPRFEEAMAELIARAAAEEGGSALAFLPGVGEIEGVRRRLEGRLPGDMDVRPIHGAMALKAQRAALAPSTEGRRKLVLATAIAETSLTVEGVRVVIDGGLARRSRFDAGSGMARLVTEPVTKAEAEQRRGRAGRLEPGVCYRLWTKAEEGALKAHPPPDILEADLAGLALELALWGASAEELPFLDAPPEGALAEARGLLRELEAVDEKGLPTEHGRRIARLPAHPRLAHMVLRAMEEGEDAGLAAELAAVLEERDPLPARASADLVWRIEALRDPGKFADERGVTPDRGRVQGLREGAKRVAQAAARALGTKAPATGKGAVAAAAVARHAARAYPDRVALRRPERKPGEAPRYLLSGGKGAWLDAEDPLGAPRMLAVADTDGNPREARIRRAAATSEAEVKDLFGDRVRWVDVCEWSAKDRAVVARQRKMFGALALDDRPWKGAPEEMRAAAMADGVRALGLDALPWEGAARRLRARVAFAREHGAELPDWSDGALLETLDDWLTPHLGGCRTAEDLKGLDLAGMLEGTLDWPQRQALEAAAPAVWVAPTGTRCPVDYEGEAPAVSVRLQEVFGLDAHPEIGTAAGRVPLLMHLLSPARRPAATTRDLPGFWRGAWGDVRRDLRGRYLKHPWPERPWEAEATARAKPRNG
ncbi:MAG: ATP-dependent helicase HrpB, partial [Pseudomonadota bacterium]